MMKIGDRIFANGTYIMAILNLTPDSFFEGSRVKADDILFRADRAIKDGASILDLGAQSTRPGHVQVSVQEELDRLIVPLERIKMHFDIPVSVDTYYHEVAEQALRSGADMINDIWGLQYERSAKMAQVIAKYNKAVCIMHNHHSTEYSDMWKEMFSFLQRGIDMALKSGIDEQAICIDGGIGFGKTREQNFEVLNNYERLSELGFPLLLGTSRKSLFGGEVKDRLAPTLESTKLAVRKNVMFVRVHDVKENAEVIRRAQC